MNYRKLALPVVLALVVVTADSLAEEASVPSMGPVPPCGTPPNPSYPDLGVAPNYRVWSRAELTGIEQPCLDLTGVKLVVAVAGSFTHSGTMDDLLNRMGSISATRGLVYWSTSDQDWRVLIKDAYAVTDAEQKRRRGDFTLEEMKSAHALFYAQKDNRSSNDVIYWMQATETSPDRIVVEVENVTAVRYLLISVFGPGDLKWTYYLERRGGDIWNYYSLGRIGEGASSLAGSHPSSYVNRAIAYYRYVAGIPPAAEPPAAK